MYNHNSFEVLLVESDDVFAAQTAALLGRNDRFSFRLQRVASLAQALAWIERESVDVVLLDLVLVDSAGTHNFTRLYEIAPMLPIILLADEANSHLATYLIRLGAKDFLLKNTLAQIGLVEVVAYAAEREHLNRRIEQENQFLGAVLDTVKSLVLVLDRDGRIVQMNRASELASGYPQETLQGKYIWEHLILPADIPFVQGMFARLHPSLFPNQFVNQWCTRDNRHRLISWTNTVLLDSSGQVEYVIGTGLDITETYAAEQELRKKDKLYRVLAANIPQTTIYLFDQAYICLLAEGQTLTALGRQGEQIVGQHLRDIVGFEAYEAIAAELETALAGQSVTFEQSLHNRLYAGQVVPVRDEDGGIFAGMMLVQDVTERKLAETRLIRAERLAALGQLAASLAHEISNPLQSISTYLELVLDYPLQSHEAREYLEIVRNQVVHLGNISQNVLGFVRAQKANRQPIDLAPLLEKVLLLVHPEFLQHNVVVQLQQSPLPQIIGIPNMLQQVFLNLALNALEAMPDGGVLQITLAPHDGDMGQEVQITFQNSSAPIPQEVLPRLFEPFFTTKPDGSGLGLWISYNLIQQHGGNLSVSNLPDGTGVGATIRLPALASPEPENMLQHMTPG